jgi:hypothetical protein
MDTVEVSNIAVEAVSNSINKQANKGAIKVTSETKKMTADIVSNVIAARKSQIESQQQQIVFSRERIQAAADELISVATNQARKESRDVLLPGDVIVAMIDIPAQGWPWWPLCKAEEG